MSYILDALRKSEQERQIAAGQGVGMLFPTNPEQAPGNNRKFMLLGAGALLLTIAVNGWLWTRVAPPEKPAAPARQANNAAPLTAASSVPATPATPATAATSPTPAPPAATPAVPTVRAKTPGAEERPRVAPVLLPETAQPPGRSKDESKSVAATAPEKVIKETADTRPPPNNGNPAGKKEESSSTPGAIPPIAIAGYIKDQAGGNLAIINDRLVREGEEIAPGLRLEKIDGENAVFTYKGQRFRR